jgi:NAD(P)-dependent dehydrogenase (short-subunit alcohol dehydrogenase family)
VLGTRDHIVPPAAATPVLGLVCSTDKHELRLEGGHVGLVVGRTAAQTTLATIIDFLRQRNEPQSCLRRPGAGRPPARTDSPRPPTRPGRRQARGHRPRRRCDPNDRASVVVAAINSLGGVDILVTNASVGTVAGTRETPEQLRAVIDLNLNGCYWMTQACGRIMEPASSIKARSARSSMPVSRPRSPTR